eukprot:8340483-Pyramimonas_sp.AAC.1
MLCTHARCEYASTHSGCASLHRPAGMQLGETCHMADAYTFRTPIMLRNRFATCTEGLFDIYSSGGMRRVYALFPRAIGSGA